MPGETGIRQPREVSKLSLRERSSRRCGERWSGLRAPRRKYADNCSHAGSA
jgi:hypothetical protein